MGQPRPLLFIFVHFTHKFYRKNCRLQQNLNSDHRNRRQACWSLDYHHGPRDLSFLFSSLQQLTVNMFITKLCRWLDSNRLPVVFKVMALPTEPQSVPIPITFLPQIWNSQAQERSKNWDQNIVYSVLLIRAYRNPAKSSPKNTQLHFCCW